METPLANDPEEDFHQAILEGDFPRFQLLLEQNDGLIHTCEESAMPGLDGVYPLHWIIAQGRLDFARELLMRGADANVVDTHGRTPLFLACCLNRTDAIPLLLRYGADPYREDFVDHATPFHVACSSECQQAVEALLAERVDPNMPNITGETPLFAAVGHASILHILLQNGVAVDARNNKGQTALMTCIHWGETHCAQLLLQHGADSNRMNPQQGTNALISAVERNRVDIVHLLLQHGTNIYQRTLETKETALQVACSRRDQDPSLVYLLLRQDPEIWSQVGQLLGAF